MNLIQRWWLRLRGYRRFEVTSNGTLVTGWARAEKYDPRFPTVTHRGWTDAGFLITFHGYAPPPPLHRNCRCAVEDYAPPR